MTAGRLERAVAESRLRLAFQPQFRLADRGLRGFEALARWTDELVEVPPSVFIPQAERLGLIGQLGLWALTEACAFLSRQLPESRPALIMGVNVSVLQLRDPSFADQAGTIVARAGLSPSSIELEITESVLIPSLDEALGQLTRLRDLGFRVALDDFGQGYSSLSYLRTLPLDTLKIDKAFIGADPALLGTIVHLGHLLHLSVVAEGVESAEQLVPLSEQGCDFVQGYYFSHPLEKDEAQRFLEGFYAGRVPSGA